MIFDQERFIRYAPFQVSAVGMTRWPSWSGTRGQGMASIAPSRLASHSPAPRPKTMSSTSTSSRFCPRSVHFRFSVADSLSRAPLRPDWASDETRVHSISTQLDADQTQIFIVSHPHQQAQQYNKDMTSRNIQTREVKSNVATVNLQAKDNSISKLLWYCCLYELICCQADAMFFLITQPI